MKRGSESLSEIVGNGGRMLVVQIGKHEDRLCYIFQPSGTKLAKIRIADEAKVCCTSLDAPIHAAGWTGPCSDLPAKLCVEMHDKKTTRSPDRARFEGDVGHGPGTQQDPQLV